MLSSQYYKLPDVIIGGYDNVRDDEGEPVPLQFRLRQYREAELNISESQFVLDGNIDEIYCKSFVFFLEKRGSINYILISYSQFLQVLTRKCYSAVI